MYKLGWNPTVNKKWCDKDLEKGVEVLSSFVVVVDESSAIAQAARCTGLGGVLLYGISDNWGQRARGLHISTSVEAGWVSSAANEVLHLNRSGSGLTVLSKQLKFPNSNLSSIRASHRWIWRSKAEHRADDNANSPPSETPALPLVPLASSEGVISSDCTVANLVGEDAAVFELTKQKTSSWLLFTAILGVVLAILYVSWIDPETGFGGEFIDAVSSVSSSHEMVMSIILFTFALVHSGLASLRGAGEKLIGERAYRVIYAASSLPLAVSAVVYFMNHRYDGLQLWDVRSIFGARAVVWALSFISFFFLYPSTFYLLEIAAVDKPKVHMWETGIMRITRHPQMVGQFLWCSAHTLWIGNSFTVITSAGLLAHHLFGVWHGDKRLSEQHGEAYEILKQRTSVFPFAAILDGRQKLPRDYYKEFLRVPYFVIACLTIGAYWSQPLLQSASEYLRW